MRGLIAAIALSFVATASAGELIVPEWLVLGTVRFEEGTDPFDTPPPAELLATAPDAGAMFDGMRWAAGRSDEGGLVDLIGRGLEPEEICSAYVHAYLFSPDERTVTLSVGSDDGIQVFLNGTELHRNWALRGWEPDQDSFSARLGAGWNRLLLRVANYTGGFGGSARIVEAEGLRSVAARPADYGPVRIEPFLDLLRVRFSPNLLPHDEFETSLELLAEIRNLGTDPASEATLIFSTGDGAVELSQTVVLDPGASTSSLLLPADAVTRAVAAESALRVRLDYTDRTIGNEVAPDVAPRELLRIVTADPPLREELPVPAAEIARGLDAWGWGERIRPELFGDDGTFARLLGSYLDRDTAGFEKSWQGVVGRIASGAEEIKRQRITFVGNSHIDMAWLWDRKETLEVVEMTYDQALKFMDEFPFFLYAQSQIQTYEWVRTLFPEMMQRMDAAVADGRWLPVGGMWVEPDCNLPSGESFVRQLTYGKHWVRDRWGIDIKLGWNPDSFGYAWTLPMIFRGAGIEYFITQKIGWNDTTEFPHRLFWWEAPDGSRVLSYFPFTYVDDARPDVLAERMALQQEQQPGLTDLLNLYGVGDHGGGPTREMIDRYVAMSEMEVYPAVEHAHPMDFMQRVERSEAGKIPVWDDELYLEYHRGTYTTQGEMKRRNRRMESALESTEKLAALAAVLVPGFDYPDAAIDGAWLRTLFNQFHDILPGSAIPEVYRDARADYDEAESLVAGAKSSALAVLAANVSPPSGKGTPVVVFNTLSWPRSEVVCLSREATGLGGDGLVAFDASGSALPTRAAGDELCFLANDIPGIGYGTFRIRRAKKPPASTLAVATDESRVVIDNGLVRAEIDVATGDLHSLVHLASGHETLERDAGGGNELQLHGDLPDQWDAWNIGYTGEQWSSSGARVEVVEQSPLRVTVRAARVIGKSTIVHDYVLHAGSPIVEIRTTANWNEEHKLLKSAFHLAVDAEAATFEIPYGTIDRPTRPVTEAEQAKWEVSGHRWVDLTDRSGEFGVTLIDDSKYGYDVRDRTLRLTLLRAPKYPDPQADIGEHRFAYALYPHEGDWRAADSYRRGVEFNVPLEPVVLSQKSKGVWPTEAQWVSADAGHVVLSVVKMPRDAERRPGFVVRVHEVEGIAGPVNLSFPFEVARAAEVNLMEDESSPLTVNGREVRLDVRAHGLHSVLVEAGTGDSGSRAVE